MPAARSEAAPFNFHSGRVLAFAILRTVNLLNENKLERPWILSTLAQKANICQPANKTVHVTWVVRLRARLAPELFRV